MLSSETDWETLSEAAKELLFLIQSSQIVKISVMLPIMVRVDNMANIFMAGSITSMSHTKHIDMKYMCMSMLSMA